MKYSRKLSYLTIFIYPIITLFLAIKNFRSPEAKNLLWLFCIFYGMVHIVFNSDGFYVDGMSYGWALERYYFNDITWNEFWRYLFSEDSNYADIYVGLLTYTLGQFTNNYNILFMCFATVFGYFYSRNIWFIIENLKQNKTLTATIVICLVFFALILPIWQINGRIWTAVHIFFYGSIQVLYYRKKKAIVWCLVAPLVHFATLFLLIVLFLFFVLPKKPFLYFIFLIFSMTISYLDLYALNEKLTAILPDFFSAKIDGYANVDFAEERAYQAQSQSLLLSMRNFLRDWVVDIALIILFFTGKSIWKTDSTLNRLYCFALFIAALASIFALIPSGGRFINYANMISMVVIIFALQQNSGLLTKFYSPIFKLVMIFLIIFSIRIGMEFFGVSSFVTNPITCWFIEDNDTMMHLIRRWGW